MTKALTDRTRTLAYQLCPRKRWWGYEYKGRGVSPREDPVPLATGKAVHVGLESLLLGKGEEEAATAALRSFSSPLGLGAEEDSHYVLEEQKALTEALVRGYARYLLPRLLDTYEILGVERELLWEGFSPTVSWMARADAELRERATGDIHVLSFKTAAQYGMKQQKEGRYDMQGISEIVALQEVLSKEWMLNSEENLLRGVPEPQVLACKMDYLVKGAREEWPKGSGVKVQQSPLIRPWLREKFGGREFTVHYEWQDETGNHRLGKEWKRANIWEFLPIERWLAQLTEEDLSKFFVSPEPYFRKPEEIESWRRATAHQETEVACASEFMKGQESNEAKLDMEFPKHTRSCLWPSPCFAIPLCHEGMTVEEGLESGQFVWRTPHHAIEKMRLTNFEE